MDLLWVWSAMFASAAVSIWQISGLVDEHAAFLAPAHHVQRPFDFQARCDWQWGDVTDVWSSQARAAVFQAIQFAVLGLMRKAISRACQRAGAQLPQFLLSCLFVGVSRTCERHSMPSRGGKQVVLLIACGLPIALGSQTELVSKIAWAAFCCGLQCQPGAILCSEWPTAMLSSWRLRLCLLQTCLGSHQRAT